MSRVLSYRINIVGGGGAIPVGDDDAMLFFIGYPGYGHSSNSIVGIDCLEDYVYCYTSKCTYNIIYARRLCNIFATQTQD